MFQRVYHTVILSINHPLLVMMVRKFTVHRAPMCLHLFGISIAAVSKEQPTPHQWSSTYVVAKSRWKVAKCYRTFLYTAVISHLLILLRLTPYVCPFSFFSEGFQSCLGLYQYALVWICTQTGREFVPLPHSCWSMWMGVWSLSVVSICFLLYLRHILCVE